jgi:hypothetical protein
MKDNWFRDMLTPAKQGSHLWQGFTDTLQQLWNELVDPLLTRISNRKSFFTMDSEDMDTRISEYGRFFVIAEQDKSKRPMLLAQRLDEIHFKGTYRPIEQTFWREFGGMPVTWEPLYAPVDQDKYPYGSFLATAAEVKGALLTYGEFFLTSRGRVVLDLNGIYGKYGPGSKFDSIEDIQQNFEDIITPLIPLHIVFDGLTLQLMLKLIEKRDVLVWQGATSAQANGITAAERVDHIGHNVNTNISNENAYPISNRPARTAPVPVYIDVMPLDAWPLGLLEIPVPDGKA